MQDILLPFPPGTTRAVFLRREKRFLALVSLNGREVWTHTNNSGSMLGLLRPGSPALISPAAGPGRKLEWTLEALHCDGSWICVNTLAPNRTLRAAWQAGLLPEAAGTTSFRAEAKVGDSRLDALLSGPGGDIWVEAKNVTLEFCGTACFPDAVTERGQKHLRELMALATQGLRTAVFYFVPMACAERFAPADFIDPNYAALFREALSRGVEAWPYRALVDERGIRLDCRLPLAGC
ncbi:DNA/RNA nuclease SfsA [Desulfocurvibacter africanus]|uniref:DNA/RNA nuclease SfsA n=1 Tax=Desulfocurvibacter africanus TaxID=873 RepID=UPI00040D317A|nr:DNA/RNA nuclease SfsA [Desulfocurvibacter africanus]